jgi:hypothetical protein
MSACDGRLSGQRAPLKTILARQGASDLRHAVAACAIAAAAIPADRIGNLPPARHVATSAQVAWPELTSQGLVWPGR